MMWPPGIAIRPIQAWPGPGTKHRTRTPFSAAWGDTLVLLRRELDALNARGTALQVDIPERLFRVDGYPRADARADHPGVILSLTTRKAGPLSFPCDRFTDWMANVRAIALAMEALRKVDRYGVTPNANQYTGFKALPAGAGNGASHLTRDDALSVIWTLTPESKRGEGLERRIRWAKAGAHPDRHGGDRTLWDQVGAAERRLSDTLGEEAGIG